MMFNSFNRRRFLKASVLSGTGLAWGAHRFLPGSPIPTPAKPLKVAVVGAGIAGLVAAFELMQSGHDVTVFEARTRPGGRIHTLRDPFADGLHAESGAGDFGDGYPLLQRYISLFDLPFVVTLATEKIAGPGDVYFLNGKRFVVPAGEEPNWPYELSPEERRLGIAGLWEKYVVPAAKDIVAPLSAPWPDPASRRLDGQTINDLLRKQGASEGAIAILRMDFLGDDFDHVSGLQDVLWHQFFERNKTFKQLRDGNDQLPRAFAKRLGDRMRYGAVLRRLSQDKDKVHLSISSAGSLEQMEVDRAVIAIPFSCLRHVELDDSFSAGKRSAISKMRYDSAIHIHLQTRTRFWEQQHLSGFANSDLPIRNVLHDTEGQAGTRGVIGIEIEGLNAKKAAERSPEERLRWAVENLAKIFPEMPANFEGGASVVWDTEPWSLGCAAFYAPGEMTTMFPHVGTAAGRIHFAGEHTSVIYVMEGAAESGIRVAQEINTAA